MELYRYKELQYTAVSRSERRRGKQNGGNVIVNGGSAVSGNAGTSGGSGGGESSGAVAQSIEVVAVDRISVQRTGTTSGVKFVITHTVDESNGESTANEILDGKFVKNIVVDKFGHVLSIEVMSATGSNDVRYLRKDQPDETNYNITFKDGLTIGDFVEGLLGGGGHIDRNGDAWLGGLHLRDFLEVPELRFNRVDVVSGELWNSVAFGTIESVDTTNRIVTLHVEADELTGLHVDDICRGIFHNVSDNETADGLDACGFEKFAGFATSYFTPTQIIDNVHFKYNLKPGTTVHPCTGMKFAVYGNFTDTTRQNSAYQTRTYLRYLRGVDDWVINQSHVSAQFGDLSGLQVNGEFLTAGSIYLNDVYFGGNILQIGGMQDSINQAVANATHGQWNFFRDTRHPDYSDTELWGGRTGGGVIIGEKDGFYVTRLSFQWASVFNNKQLPAGTPITVTFWARANYDYATAPVALQVYGIQNIKEFTCDGAPLRLSSLQEYNMSGEWHYYRVVAKSNGDWIRCECSTEDYMSTTTCMEFYGFCVTEGETRTADWVPHPEDTDVNAQQYTQQVYCRSNTQPATPSGATPAGWTIDPPTGTAPLWMTRATFAGDGSIASAWSTPIKITGDSITATETSYSVTNSGTTIPLGWVNYVPAANPGQYLWTRLKITYSTGAESTTYSVARQGENGANGANGRGIKTTAITYATSASGTSAPGSGWSTSIPTVAAGKFLWTRTIISYTDNTTTTSYTVSRQGTDGAAGAAGPMPRFRGEYDSNKTYYGTATYVDIVKNGNYYYKAKTTAGTFTGSMGDSSKWELCNSFENIATGFLFAEEALIAGWYFSNDYIYSPDNKSGMYGSSDNTLPRFWAGAAGRTTTQINAAPFRVDNSGNVYASKLYATGGSIGGFTINSDSLGAGDGNNYQGMRLRQDMISFNKWTYDGYPIYANNQELIQLGVDNYSTGVSRYENLFIRNSRYSDNVVRKACIVTEQTNSNGAIGSEDIIYSTYSAGGSRRVFAVGFANTGDAEWYKRICIRATVLPTRAALQARVVEQITNGESNPAFYNVLWDARSGCFCIE